MKVANKKFKSIIGLSNCLENKKMKSREETDISSDL